MQQHLGENMVEITHRLSQNKPNEEPSCCHPWQLPQCMNTLVLSRSSFRETVMSACLDMCLDSECISLNPLALFKPFCLNTHAACLEELGFLLPCFYRAHYFWKEEYFIISIFHSSWWGRKSVDSRMRSLLVLLSLLPSLEAQWKTGSKTGILVQWYTVIQNSAYNSINDVWARINGGFLS